MALDRASRQYLAGQTRGRLATVGLDGTPQNKPGSPFGVTLQGYEQLHATHVRLKQQARGGASSRYEIVQVLAIAPNVAVAHVRRVALDPADHPLGPNSDVTGPFSEMALYVLVRRDRTWWLAAGQNTPCVPDRPDHDARPVGTISGYRRAPGCGTSLARIWTCSATAASKVRLHAPARERTRRGPTAPTVPKSRPALRLARLTGAGPG
jgi:uncharacterized protein (TIGR02246 family)